MFRRCGEATQRCSALDGSPISSVVMLIERCCVEQGVRPNQLVLQSDNGDAMKGSTMLAKLQQLGVMPSFSRPHVSDDNAFAESVMRTVKYNPSYPDGPFSDLDAARAGHRLRRVLHGQALPQCRRVRHAGAAPPRTRPRDPRSHRKAIYAAAWMRRPDRWLSYTRRWVRPDIVKLNPRTPVEGRQLLQPCKAATMLTVTASRH